MRKWIVFACLSALLGYCSPHRTVPVAFLRIDTNAEAIKESEAVLHFLDRLSGVSCSLLDIRQLKESGNLRKYGIVWLHFPDSVQVSTFLKDSNAMQQLRNYANQGGKVLLTLEAVTLLNSLVPEDTPVESRTVTLMDEGYGRQAGLHAFISHPLFAGMNGGAYIFNPLRDTSIRINGFFGPALPSKGRVIAVDWAYIFMKEENKLVLEYSSGKGRILAIGAYTLFSPGNRNRSHLELFIKNTVNYLSQGDQQQKQRYWDYQEQNVTAGNPGQHQTVGYAPPRPWKISNSPLDLYSDSATNSLWNIASPRMLLMGKETAGMEEIWAHPFMALRDYEAGIRLHPFDTVTWFSSLVPDILVTPSAFIRNYSLNSSRIRESVTGSPSRPVGVVHYEITGNQQAELIVRFKSNLRLMWPYSEKVLTRMEYTWDNGLNAFVINDGYVGLTVMAGSNRKPVQTEAGRYGRIEPEGDNLHSTPTGEFQVMALMRFSIGAEDQLDIVIAAGSEGKAKVTGSFLDAVSDPFKVYTEMEAYTQELFNNSLIINTPDKDFNTGYRWALVGTDRFFVETPGIGGSLVAGYATTRSGWDGEHRINGRPGYGWYFGRDGQWSGMALLDYGDFEKVKQMLEVYERFQDLNGKIYHELSTSGVVHYDAADATPLYVILAGRYLRHSGDLAFIQSSWPSIRKAIDFCFSTDTDGDHLIENTHVGHGWTEGGGLYGTHSTLYLVSCWAEALRQASYMANCLGKTSEAEHYGKESEQVIRIINSDFLNAETGFFNDGIYRDGSFLTEPTIQVSIPLYFAQTPEENATPMIRAMAGNSFTSNWGARIISQESQRFNPRGYHTGSVWPLYTGWVALAEYQYGHSLQGFSHIMNNLLIYRHWSKGFIEEVLHGLEYKPSGVCPHQCWSETMVLQPAIEGMLGLECNALEKSLTLAPAFPFDWDSVSAEHIRIGNHRIDFVYIRSGNSHSYSITPSDPEPMNIAFGPLFPAGWKAISVSLDGTEIEYELTPSAQGIRCWLEFSLDGNHTVNIIGEKGISMLPLVAYPRPGDPGNGTRILSASLSGNRYSAVLEGPSGTTGHFDLWISGFQIISSFNIDSIEKNNELLKIGVKFDPSNDAYVRKEISLEFN